MYAFSYKFTPITLGCYFQIEQLNCRATFFFAVSVLFRAALHDSLWSLLLVAAEEAVELLSRWGTSAVSRWNGCSGWINDVYLAMHSGGLWVWLSILRLLLTCVCWQTSGVLQVLSASLLSVGLLSVDFSLFHVLDIVSRHTFTQFNLTSNHAHNINVTIWWIVVELYIWKILYFITVKITHDDGEIIRPPVIVIKLTCSFIIIHCVAYYSFFWSFISSLL